ncbi:MAG: Ig-like domain-containing protein, partial [Fibrobacterota bacterium]
LVQTRHHHRMDQELAKRLVANDSVVRGAGFPAKNIVPGIDNNAVLDSAMSILVVKGMPLSAVIPGTGAWALGLDTLAIHVRVKALVAAGKISADTAKLFPPYPVRVKSPVTLDSVLAAGGAAIPVKGAFEATYQLSGKLIRVFRDTQDVSALFDISSFELLERPKSFDLSGKLQIGAKESAVPGSYRLEVMVQDDSLRKAISSAGFRVTPAADKIGPVIEILSPASGTVLDNATTSVLVKVNASDASGVDSVWISDRLASFVDGSWTVDSVGIPVTDIGFVVVVRAKDGKGNTASKDILVGRKAKLDPGAPSWTVLSPKSNELYPFDSSTVAVRWKVRDPRASIVSAPIGGGAATEAAAG